MDEHHPRVAGLLLALVFLATLNPASASVCVLTAKIDSGNSALTISGSVKGVIEGGVEQDTSSATLEGALYIVFPAGV
jgi:hypothetical protein